MFLSVLAATAILIGVLRVTERYLDLTKEPIPRNLFGVALSGYGAAAAGVFSALAWISAPMAGLAVTAVGVMAALFATEAPH